MTLQYIRPSRGCVVLNFNDADSMEHAWDGTLPSGEIFELFSGMEEGSQVHDQSVANLIQVASLSESMISFQI